MQELAVRELVVEVSRYLVNASNRTRPASKWEKAFHFTARNLPTDNLTDCLSHAPTTRLNGEFQGLRIPKSRAITRYLSSDSLLSAQTTTNGTRGLLRSQNQTLEPSFDS